jgi:hypothetical protein
LNGSIEALYRDVNVTLVIWKSLLTFKDNLNKSWLYTSIFYSTCTIKGKVCKLIKDSKSCKKVVSTIIVKKLLFRINKHPKPYKLN